MPQGSIIGCTVFLSFINDLPLHLNHYLADLYADDNTIHASGKSKPEIVHKLQSDANETEVWRIKNKLPIHYGNSTTMTMGSIHKVQQAGQLNISIGNTQLNPVCSHKLLGIHIDETLSWNQHIDDLCSIITSRSSLLRQLSYYVPENAQKCFIKAMWMLSKNEYRKNSHTAKESHTYHFKS